MSEQNKGDKPMEMDSPTKSYMDFSDMIGETEASMRSKLSELTMPESGKENASTDSEPVKGDNLDHSNHGNNSGESVPGTRSKDLEHGMIQLTDTPVAGITLDCVDNSENKLNEIGDSGDANADKEIEYVTGQNSNVSMVSNEAMEIDDYDDESGAPDKSIGNTVTCIDNRSMKEDTVNNLELVNETNVEETLVQQREEDGRSLSQSDVAGRMTDAAVLGIQISDDRLAVDSSIDEYIEKETSPAKDGTGSSEFTNDKSQKEDISQTESVDKGVTTGSQETIQGVGTRDSHVVPNIININDILEDIESSEVKSNTQLTIQEVTGSDRRDQSCSMETDSGIMKDDMPLDMGANNHEKNNDKVNPDKEVVTSKVTTVNDSVDGAVSVSTNPQNEMGLSRSTVEKLVETEGGISEGGSAHSRTGLEQMKHSKNVMIQGEDSADEGEDFGLSTAGSCLGEGFMVITDVRSLIDGAVVEQVKDTSTKETVTCGSSDSNHCNTNENITEQVNSDSLNSLQTLATSKSTDKALNISEETVKENTHQGSEEKAIDHETTNTVEVVPDQNDTRNSSDLMSTSHIAVPTSVSSETNITSRETETLPIISNTFSMAGIPYPTSGACGPSPAVTNVSLANSDLSSVSSAPQAAKTSPVLSTSAIVSNVAAAVPSSVVGISTNLSPVLPNPIPIASSAIPIVSQLSAVVKEEPADNGTYGVIETSPNVRNSRAAGVFTTHHAPVTCTPTTAAMHKGHILSAGKDVSKAANLVVSKVPQIQIVYTTTQHAPVTPFPVSIAYSTSLNGGKSQPSRIIMPKPAVTMSTKANKVAPLTSVSKDKVAVGNKLNNLSTINIHSVGVARITDLIARKNPIPTYKPEPKPTSLTTPGEGKPVLYPCYECGDSFYFPKSLRNHFGRRSMKIYYKCEKCSKTIMFSNKCQLLNHLRSHLNIRKTQAVPIHIKSDSIEIETHFKDIKADEPFEWYKDSKPMVVSGPNKTFLYFLNDDGTTNIDSSSEISSADVNDKTVPKQSKFNCMRCSKEFSNAQELTKHMEGGDKLDYFYCSECPLYMTSACALDAHKNLHQLSEIKLNQPLSKKHWHLVTNLQCPECGINFWEGLFKIKVGGIESFLSTVVLHLKSTCHHLSRLPAYSCSKCSKVFQSFIAINKHLNLSLEHYYKCGMCPMALKSLKSLDSHYKQRHANIDESSENQEPRSKLIYRCHICDTLIDDKAFLIEHTEKHLEEIRQCPQMHYHCLQCGRMFMTLSGLKTHAGSHKGVKRQFYCTFCNVDKGRPVAYMSHLLTTHTCSKSNLTSKSVVKFCDYCGLVCIGEHMIKVHACLGMRNAPVVIGDSTQRKQQPEIQEGNTKGPSFETSTPVEPADQTDIPEHLNRSCVYCYIWFTSESNRVKHIKEHREKNEAFICMMCDSCNFKTIHELRSHEIACTAMKKATGESATVQGNFRPLIRDVVQVYSCSICEASNFTNMNDLKIHKKLCAGMIKSSKIMDSKSTHGKYNSSHHSKKHIDSKDQEVNADGVKLKPKSQSKSSKGKGDVVPIYTCNKCDVVFPRYSLQEEHEKLEHGFHPCHLCGVMFESQSSMKKHLMVDHEGKRTVFYCRICRSRKTDRPFTTREKLESHLHLKHRMKVIDETKIITELPGLPEMSGGKMSESEKRKAPTSASPEISVKKLKVEGESEFKCAKCLFTCNIMSTFREHILQHKAADTYQCFECGLCFSVLPSLRKHLFMVHKVRNFAKYMEENQIEEPEAIEDLDDESEDVRVDTETEDKMEDSSEEEDSSNPLECKVCYRLFDSDKGLKSHMRTHGMAFIKKSRRRSQPSSAEKKQGSTLSCVQQSDNLKKDGLILKIKVNRLDTNSLSIYTKVDKNSSDLEPVDTDNVQDIAEPVKNGADESVSEQENMETKLDNTESETSSGDSTPVNT